MAKTVADASAYETPNGKYSETDKTVKKNNEIAKPITPYWTKCIWRFKDNSNKNIITNVNIINIMPYFDNRSTCL